MPYVSGGEPFVNRKEKSVEPTAEQIQAGARAAFPEAFEERDRPVSQRAEAMRSLQRAAALHLSEQVLRAALPLSPVEQPDDHKPADGKKQA